MDNVILRNAFTEGEGKYEKFKNKKYINFDDAVLLKTTNSIFGPIYFLTDKNSYKKIKDIDNIKLSYYFVDANMFDSDDPLQAKYKLSTNNAVDIFNELLTIATREYLLNDVFWIYDSAQSYYFTDININAKFKGKNKQRFNFNKDGSTKFFSKLYSQTALDKIIIFKSNDNYKITDINNISNYKIDKYDKTFIRIYRDWYIRCDYKMLKKLKSLIIKLFVKELEYGDIFNSTTRVIDNSKEYFYEEILEASLYKTFIGKIVSDCSVVPIKVTTKLKQINNKDAKISFKKLIKKTFKSYYKFSVKKGIEF